MILDPECCPPQQVQTVLFEEFHITSDEDKDHFKSVLSSAALIGAVIGQLTFGALADWMGRRIIFLITGSTIVLGSLLSSLAQAHMFPGSTNQVLTRHNDQETQQYTSHFYGSHPLPLSGKRKGTQTQTFWSGYFRVGWGSST